MLLDTYNEVYVWIGQGANDAEKKSAVETAAEYIKNAPDKRNDDTPIIALKQGFEPLLFTSNFVSWNPEKAKVRCATVVRTCPSPRMPDVVLGAGGACGHRFNIRMSPPSAPFSFLRGRQAGINNYDDIKAQMLANNTSTTVVTAESAATAAATKKVIEKFTFLRLQERPLPDGVDTTQLENHLLDDEFPKAFGMSFAEFMAMPKWKRDAKKKEKKLF